MPTRWSSLLSIVGMVVLGGCGFEPLLADGKGHPIAEDLARIRVSLISDRSGQVLRNFLLDDLTPRGTLAGTAYTLDVRLSEPQQQIAIRRDESSSRVSYTANAAFNLRDVSGHALYSGSASSNSTYEATNSEFASISGQLNARDRALREISADIRQQLAAYFNRARRRSGTDSPPP